MALLGRCFVGMTFLVTSSHQVAGGPNWRGSARGRPHRAAPSCTRLEVDNLPNVPGTATIEATPFRWTDQDCRYQHWGARQPVV